MAECNKCGLRYSSYCIDCLNVKQGLNLTDKEYTEHLKSRTQKKDVGSEEYEQSSIDKHSAEMVQVGCIRQKDR